MGTDVHGIIKHKLSYPPHHSLPDELNGAINSDNPFLRGTWSWNVGALERKIGWGLMRDGHTEIWFGSKAADLATGTEWIDASEDKELRRNLLIAMFELARFFNSPTIILMPDDEDPWLVFANQYLRMDCLLRKSFKK